MNAEFQEPQHNAEPLHNAAAPAQPGAAGHDGAAAGHDGAAADHDGAAAGHQTGGHETGAAGHSESPLDHIVQHPLIERPANLGPLTPNGVVTVFSDQIAMLVLAGLLLMVCIPLIVRRRRGKDAVGALVPTGGANMIEMVCDYLRKEVAQPTLHQHTDRFIKYIWSVFFFVLTVNLLGLLPIPAVSALFGTHLGGTATGNVWVTATLAIVTMAMMVVNGLRIGGKSYIAHFCPGPLWLAPLLVPVEIIGLIAKVFALAVRLFANMIAGHILLAVLLSFILSAGSVSAAMGLGIAIPVVIASAAISLLELFVAFLQAFIFTFLTTLFIGMSVVFHHDDHHSHEAAAH
jgi:F-type H+-transporting ATPase subunit a